MKLEHFHQIQFPFYSEMFLPIFVLLITSQWVNVFGARDSKNTSLNQTKEVSGKEKVSIVFNEYYQDKDCTNSQLIDQCAQFNDLSHKVDEIDKMLRDLTNNTITPDKSTTNQDLNNSIKREKRIRGKYLGCFPEHPRLNGFNGSSGKNTVEVCIAFCRSGNYVYAAMQASAYCSCGNSLIDVVQNEPARCDCLCSGTDGKYCGGWTSKSVYETGLEEYIIDEEGRQLRQSYIEPNKTIEWANVNNSGYTG